MVSEGSSDRALLEGLKVVELATWIFAPLSACVLGELGADVIKVEAPSGDPMRGLVPRVQGEVDWVWELANRNKRAVTLDLRQASGAEVLGRLLAEADVFIVNLRGGALERLGIDYGSLRGVYPRLIYAHATGYGTEGGDVERPAYDELAYWARGGFMSVLGGPGGEPVRLAGAMGDMPSALHLAGAIFAALYSRERTGAGQYVGCSLYGGGIWANGFAVQGSLSTGRAYPRSGRYDTVNPLYNSYCASDGKWLQLAMIEEERYWAAFAEAASLPVLVEDVRFGEGSARRRHTREAVELIEGRIGEESRAYWAGVFDGRDFPWAPASDVLEVGSDGQALANGYVRSYEHRSGLEQRTLGLPFQLERGRSVGVRSAPELGEHTEVVLEELGYGWDEILALKGEGVIL